MQECKPESAVSAHGYAADGPASASSRHPIFLFYVGDEFLQKEVVVAKRAVRRVDGEAPPAIRRHDEKVAQFVLMAQVVDQGPGAAVEQRLFVVTQAVQEVENG